MEEDINNIIRIGKRAPISQHGFYGAKSIILYGGKTLSFTKKIKYKMRTDKLEFLERCSQVIRENTWRAERVWQKMEITSAITRNLNNRQFMWYGYVKRMPMER